MGRKESKQTNQRGFRANPQNPLPAPVFKYPMKMKSFGLSETKWFHFHGILKIKWDEIG